jgi:hypothetical protein
MANKTNATDILTGQIATLSTEQIISGVKAIGGAHVDTDQRMVRAYMIEELIKREGVEAGDALMDEVGL